ASLCAPSATHLPPRPPLFPYTTLFRSRTGCGPTDGTALVRYMACASRDHDPRRACRSIGLRGTVAAAALVLSGLALAAGDSTPRSEEHTSELQSRENLVCRLLLEKKKT